jgi:hypothetical protein
MVVCLATPIDVLNIPRRTITRLKRIGVGTVEDLARFTPEGLCGELGIKNIILCRTVVARARGFLEARRSYEKSKEFYRQYYGRQPGFVEMLEGLLRRPLLILAPTVFEDGTGNIYGYCANLYAYSLETGTPEKLIERCYESEEEFEREFRRASEIAKQRLGSLVCVQGVDGDCFELLG